MKATFAAITALAAVASAQTTTPAPTTTGWWGPGNWDLNGDGDSGPGPFGGRLDSSQSAVFNSYTSAHPYGPSSGDWESLTSALSLTWASQWSNFPSGFPTSLATKFGGPGWGYGQGNGGWNHGGGRGGPFGGAWGADDGDFCSTGSWTSGAWTSWWGGKGCPASDWPGWTSGSWSTNAPWTSWAGCTASVTATSVFTTTPANATAAVTSTSFGYQVAQATNSLVSTTAQDGAGSRPVATGAVMAGALVGAIAML